MACIDGFWISSSIAEVSDRIAGGIALCRAGRRVKAGLCRFIIIRNAITVAVWISLCQRRVARRIGGNQGRIHGHHRAEATHLAYGQE